MNHNKAKGFTLIEILVGLLLISLTFGLVITNVDSSRDRLEEVRQQIERSIVFSIDEAAIRNTLVRIHFIFDDQQQKIGVESGEVGNTMLPSFLFQEQENIKEEELKKQKKELKNRFQLLKDFQESMYSIENDIRIIGVASSISRQLVTEGEAAVYFYPSGEKDDALIIIGSEQELIAMKISAFLLKVDLDYHPLELLPEDNIFEKQQELAKEIFEKWLKQ
jgi:prepilin-type N-terminal cleavage/methylation domain-containing protein